MIRRNIFSISFALLILVLSLTGSDTFDRLHIPDITFLDKIVHSAMYFILMILLIYENKELTGRLKNWFVLAAIPFIYGAVIELLQNVLTDSRNADILDILFNLSGIIIAIGFWFIIKRIAGRRVR